MKVVKDGTTSFQKYNSYTHTLNDNGKFHIIEFINCGDTINTNGVGTTTKPIMDVDEVRVYFCSLDGKPLMIYYKIDGSHSWYKNDDTANNAGKWVPEESLSQYAPSDSSDSYEKILKVLNGLESECNPEKTPETAEFGTGAAETGIIAVLTGIGTYGGPLAGTGTLTGLGWWIYKRSKGDPWVRQI